MDRAEAWVAQHPDDDWTYRIGSLVEAVTMAYLLPLGEAGGDDDP